MSAVVLVAQAEHVTPFTGSWKLNAAKFKFNPPPGLQSATITIETVHAVISPHRETMTVAVTGKYPQRRSMDDVEVFEKK